MLGLGLGSRAGLWLGLNSRAEVSARAGAGAGARVKCPLADQGRRVSRSPRSRAAPIYIDSEARMAGRRGPSGDWPRLAGAWGSLGHALALREASGAPAGRGLCRGRAVDMARHCRHEECEGGEQCTLRRETDAHHVARTEHLGRNLRRGARTRW